MNVQELEYNAEFRIKFASINKSGGFEGDALEEYASIFPDVSGELFEGWRYESADRVETRFEHDRDAWGLSYENAAKDEIRVAAIEHETGIELLAIPIITGIISGVSTAAVVGLTGVLWKKWNESRGPNKLPSSLILEKVENRNDDGSIQSVKKLEVRGPIDPGSITSITTSFFGGG